MTATRAQVIVEARQWLGTPWQHQQRSKGVAVDCAGLVIGVARALGLVAPEFDITGYPRVPAGDAFLDECDRYMDRIRQADMQPGDVVAVRFDSGPQHIGILAPYLHGGQAIVHAASNRGRVIETRLLFGSAPRAMKFARAYILPGVA